MSALQSFLSCVALMAFCMLSSVQATGGSLDIAFMPNFCGPQVDSTYSISLEPGCNMAANDAKCDFWSQAKCVAGLCHVIMYFDQNCSSQPIGKMQVEIGLCHKAIPERQDGHTGFYNATHGQYSPC